MKKPYTQLENETLEALAKGNFTARELRVMLAVLRLTNGYHLQENQLKMQYLQQLTGLDRSNLWRAIDCLVTKQVLAKVARGVLACHGPALWNLNVVNSTTSQDVVRSTMTCGQLDNKMVVDLTTSPGVSKTKLRSASASKENIKKTYKENVRALARASTQTQKGEKVKHGVGAPTITEIFQEMRDFLGFPGRTAHDPIPNYGKEGQAIKRMLTRGFTRVDILACWKSKVSQRGGEFVSMTWVNEDIGRRKEPSYKEKSSAKRESVKSGYTGMDND